MYLNMSFIKITYFTHGRIELMNHLCHLSLTNEYHGSFSFFASVSRTDHTTLARQNSQIVRQRYIEIQLRSPIILRCTSLEGSQCLFSNVKKSKDYEVMKLITCKEIRRGLDSAARRCRGSRWLSFGFSLAEVRDIVHGYGTCNSKLGVLFVAFA